MWDCGCSDDGQNIKQILDCGGRWGTQLHWQNNLFEYRKDITNHLKQIYYFFSYFLYSVGFLFYGVFFLIMCAIKKGCVFFFQ